MINNNSHSRNSAIRKTDQYCLEFILDFKFGCMQLSKIMNIIHLHNKKCQSSETEKPVQYSFNKIITRKIHANSDQEFQRNPLAK